MFASQGLRFPRLSLPVTLGVVVACLVSGVCPSSAAAACNFLPPGVDRESEGRPILVGALGIKGEENLFTQWNNTFSTYLTATAGDALGGNTTFQLVYLDFDTAYEAAEHGCVDFLFVNPSMYSCLEMQYGAAAFATLINFREGYELDRFYGTIFTRADREDIKELADLKGKIVEAVSISGLGACQLQWHELLMNGVDFLNDPKQVRFSFDQTLIVEDVIAGRADVGMVRTDMAEGMAAAGRTNLTDIRVINQKDDPDFPFNYSTRLAAPEWPLASLPHTSIDVIEEVMHAVLQLTANHTAAKQGKYSAWRLPVSYLGMHQMMTSLNWIQNGECIRSKDTYDAIVCPEHHVKLASDKVVEACADQAAADARFSCPDNYTCVCQPCYRLPEQQISVSLAIAASQHRLSGETSTEESNETPRKMEFVPTEGTCEKLEICAVVSRLDSLQVNLNDAWHAFRADLGLQSIESVWYRWWSSQTDTLSASTSSGAVQWRKSTRGDGVGNHSFVIVANAVGSFILEVKTEMSGGNLSQIEASPIIITVEELDCPGQFSLPGPTGCICATNTHLEFGECVSNTAASQKSLIIIAVVAPCVVVALLLFALLAYLRFRRRQGDAVWKISKEDLVFGAEPEVLGEGSSGNAVRKAKYRGTTVAVKSLVQRKTIGGGGRRFSSAREVNLLALQQAWGSPARSKEPRATALAAPDNQSNPMLKPIPRATGNDTSLIVSSSWRRSLSSSARRSCDVEAAQGASGYTSSSNRVVPGTPTATAVTPMRSLAELLEQVKSMVYLRHPNITTVMGVSMDDGEALLVMEYMQHRSLGELLQNETVPLEAEAVQSIAKDVACGMLYLHSHKPPVLHMDLKSGNVLIDGSFRAKLADFGLSRSRRSVRSDNSTRFLAPELLLDGREPSKTTDVYAMGILLFELLTRTKAFSDLTPSEIATQVSDTRRAEPFRPVIPDHVPKEAAALMADCWHQRPEDRPTFLEIYTRISAWQPWETSERRGARVASINAMAIDLSQEEVLHKVFPRHVADALAQGRKVEPEHHEAVTIFFSDIVGFTDISRTLDAVDVMNMLDRLYTEFDSLAERERVFKVETIGDAYMAVANLAEKQPDHALRIARFAMAAVEAANTVLINENDPSLGYVNIRVGFHTGPVVASVVGKLSPRYCLFGDTVNTASRMESTSSANMIHCSEKSASLLMKIAGEQLALQCRGEISIKGKGNLVTYWVLPPVANISAAGMDMFDGWTS